MRCPVVHLSLRRRFCLCFCHVWIFAWVFLRSFLGFEDGFRVLDDLFSSGGVFLWLYVILS